ncbi:MAG: RDD family protein [Acidobacteriaceae bacterium]
MSTALSAPQHQITVPTPEQATSVDWKQQLAERLDSYRAKHSEASDSPLPQSHGSENSRASKIARAVASRYAEAPTYRELLLAAAKAEEAFLAEQKAKAEQAARAAALRQEAARSLESESLPPSPRTPVGEEDVRGRFGSSINTQPAKAIMPEFAARSREMHLHQAAQEPEPSLEDLLASALVEPRSVLPSKLIEFPRELVSAHRARPRLAENVAREQVPAIPETEPPPLRIFEVQPEAKAAVRQSEIVAQAELPLAPAQLEAVATEVSATKELDSSDRDEPQDMPHAVAPAALTSDVITQSAPQSSVSASWQSATGSGTPSVQKSDELPPSPVRAFKGLEWAAISLDKEPAAYRRKAETPVAEYVPFMIEPASIDRRVMAFAVDFAAVTAGFLGFLVVFAASTPHLPTGLTAVALGTAVYASLWVLYQMLFFSLSGATAGMLYAHIALCTFDDQNPTRRALRQRLAAWWLSCLPLGLGFLWCFVDEDNLCWHDRITRMYQRIY